MTEKFGTIKNPLTIIAIFAGIVEISGTVILPFISEANQKPFIYFLVGFPILLVILFFATLNWNSKALYAPSDFTDEQNYVKMNKFDVSKQENIEVSVKKDDLLQYINESFNNFREEIVEEIGMLSVELNKGPSCSVAKSVCDTKIQIANTELAPALISRLTVDNFVNVEVYHFEGGKEITYTIEETKAIWIGNLHNVEALVKVIKIAKEVIPQLEYIQFVNHLGNLCDIFIGGSTETAIKRKLKKLSNEDFEFIYTSETLEEIVKVIS